MLLRSWGLFCACWRILRSQPSLAIYPVISGAASLLFVAVFLLPLYFGGYFDTIFRTGTTTTSGSMSSLSDQSTTPWQMWVVMFLLGLILNLVTNYCNAAFTTAILIRLSGSQVTVGEAFSVAAARFPAIFGFSMIGASVGLVLLMIEERVGVLARILGIFAGLAWAVVTFLVVPVLVVENVGPIEGIKRSMSLLRKTWGEGLICNAGIGAASGLLSFVIMLFGGFFIVLAVMTESLPLIALAVAATIVALIAIAVIARTLSGIFTAALYAYATGRGMMPGIPSDAIAGAFGPRTKKGF